MTVGQMSGKGKGARSSRKLEDWQTENYSGILVKRQRREDADDDDLVLFRNYPGRCVELPESAVITSSEIMEIMKQYLTAVFDFIKVRSIDITSNVPTIYLNPVRTSLTYLAGCDCVVPRIMTMKSANLLKLGLSGEEVTRFLAFASMDSDPEHVNWCPQKVELACWLACIGALTVSESILHELLDEGIATGPMVIALSDAQLAKFFVTQGDIIK
jgi:hypothetical protein